MTSEGYPVSPDRGHEDQERRGYGVFEAPPAAPEDFPVFTPSQPGMAPSPFPVFGAEEAAPAAPAQAAPAYEPAAYEQAAPSASAFGGFPPDTSDEPAPGHWSPPPAAF
ncbi:MAG: hypothetical protein HOV79_00965, partial [Hamadaea sp.]|nr:hypothetical protein [Hamadaea sp.]